VQNLSYKTLFLIIILLLIPIVFILRLDKSPKAVQADWYNDAWTYRQAINVTAHTAAETNKYIIVTINIGTTIKAQADDGDFRFTNNTGQLDDIQIFTYPLTSTLVETLYNNGTAFFK
jgi:hypothetical protein